MTSYDDVGRIPRHAFLVSTTLLFIVCILSVCARYYIRLAIQKDFALDDAFLAFGTACLSAAMVVLYISTDNMYLIEAITYAPTRIVSSPKDLDTLFAFHKQVTASLILTWVAMMAVKFAFLALFRRLIDRIPPLIKYWRVVVTFNLIVTVYGALVYIVTCPHFSGTRVASCLGGSTKRRTIQYALSQLVLDVFGDLLILYIPFQLIWRVKIKLIQKVALACSQCLTVIVVIFTVTRASGLEWQDKLDVLWEIYFQIVAAEVGLILAAMTSFRALFVSRAARNRRSPESHASFWVKGKLAVRRYLDPRLWRSKHSQDMTRGQESGTTNVGFDRKLPSFPRATMTGINTFINHSGEAPKLEFEFSTYPASVEDNADTSPFFKDVSISRGRELEDSHDQSEPERLEVAGPLRYARSRCTQPICNGKT